MTETEALLNLNADRNNWKQVLSDKVFEHKNYIFRTTLVPEICHQRSKRLHNLFLAQKALDPFEESMIDLSGRGLEVTKLNTLTDLLGFYRLYESKVAFAKGMLMQQYNPYEASLFVGLLGDIEKTKLLSVATVDIQQPKNHEVKISEFSDSGQIVHELKSKDLSIGFELYYDQSELFQIDHARSVKYANFVKSRNK